MRAAACLASLACLHVALAASPADSAREVDAPGVAPADPARDGGVSRVPPVSAADAAAPEAPSPAAGARLFETWELGADLGILFPAGRLARVLDPAPCLGFRLLSSYYGPWRAFGSIDLARLDGERSPVAVGMATGAAGFARQAASAWIPSPGIGLAYHYVRALGKAGAADEYLFLEDGESEFGSRAALRWSFPAGKRLALSAGARWDAMFTEPGYGHAFALHLGAAWTRR